MERATFPSRVPALVLPRWRVVYVATPKAGGTSLLLALAILQGEDIAQFGRSAAPEVTRSLTLHDGELWRNTVPLWRLTDDELRSISPDNGWFVFSATRHPLTRLWSAWQSKLLMREPIYFERYSDRHWFPRIATTDDDIRRDFYRHVAALPAEPDLVEGDPHWMPQGELLGLPYTDYAHIGKVEVLDRTYDALEAHLRNQGWRGRLERKHENSGLLPLREEYLTPAVRKIAAQIYGADFERFGYSADGVLGCHSGGEQRLRTSNILETLPQIIARHDRIGDLSRTMASLTDALHTTEADWKSAADRLSQADSELRCKTEAVATLESELAAERRAREDAVDELERLKKSRMFRYTRSLRTLYASLRRARVRRRGQ